MGVGELSVDCFDWWFLPDLSALGDCLSGLLGSFSWSLPPSCSGWGSYRCPSCSSHPSPAWFSLKTSASWVSTVVSAPDSERAFAFGSFSLLGIQLGLVAVYPSG